MLKSGASSWKTRSQEYTYWHDIVDTWWKGEARRIAGPECQDQFDYLMWTADDEYVKEAEELENVSETGMVIEDAPADGQAQ